MRTAAARGLLVHTLLFVTAVYAAAPLFAQTTVGTGSIVGTASDPSGAVVAGAQVTIRIAATEQVIELRTNSSGSFNSGALIPGNYKTQIAAKGFRSLEVSTTVVVRQNSSRL